MVIPPEKTSPAAVVGISGCSISRCTSATVTELGRRAFKRQCTSADGAVNEEPAADGSISYRGFTVSTATVAAGALLTYLSLSIDDAHPLGGGPVKPPAPRYRRYSLASATSAVMDGTGEHEAVASMPSLPGTSHSRRLAATAESLRGAAQGIANTKATEEATTLALGELVQERERDLEAEESASSPPRTRALFDRDRVNPTRLETEGDRAEEGTPSLSGIVNDVGAVAESPGHMWSSSRSKPRCYIHGGVHRCHANVFFFGISKCGTTSLAHWMGNHPALRWITNIHYPDRVMAEAHIFDTSVENWRKMIKSGRTGEWGITTPEANITDVVIDYTPHYSIVPEVSFRILDRYGKKALDGSTKYIVLLREPVARTISSWEFKFDLKSVGGKSTKWYAEGRSLAKTVSDGLQGVKQLLKCREKYPELAKKTLSTVAKLDLFRCHPRNFMEKNLYVAHVGKSMYALQLERWFTLLGRDNIKVVFLEEMTADPVGTLQSVFEFIGLDLLDKTGKKGLSTREEWERVVTISHNQTQNKKKEILDEEVTPELVQELRDFYAPHNSQLEEILGQPLPESWSTSSRA